MSSTTSQFLMGMTARFFLSCASWTVLRLSRAALFTTRQPIKVSVRKAFIKNMAYCKIWVSSFLLETSVSSLVVPGPFIVGKHVSRVMLDSFMPIISDILFKLDNFSHAGFLSFASKNLLRIYATTNTPQPSNNNNSSSSQSSDNNNTGSGNPNSPLSFQQSAVSPAASTRSVAKDRNNGLTTTTTTPLISDPIAGATSFERNGGSGVVSGGGSGSGGHVQNTSTGAGGTASISNAFVYQLPTTVIHLAKLGVRVHRLGMKRTRVFRCLGVALLQYIVRVPLMSFATMLPMSDSELAFCSICTVIDKCSDAYLYYHTWPFPDWTSEHSSGSGVVMPASSTEED